MEMSEFLEPREEEQTFEELDVQKAVVESLAADKAQQDEHISMLRKQNETLKSEIMSLKSEISALKEKIAEMSASLEKVGDLLAANSESEASNKISLIDRDIEIKDRFEGETRDHVLEVIAEARDSAEKTGKIRRAQLLEGILCANAPLGNLLKRRQELKKLFNDNSNLINGTVIAELDKMGISYKNGEEYLLASEIVDRTY